MLKTIFVSVGMPMSIHPMANKVACNVQTDTQTDIQVAKMCRKKIADDTVIEIRNDRGDYTGKLKKANPADLYYEIYEHVKNEDGSENTIPCAASCNSPFMNMTG